MSERVRARLDALREAGAEAFDAPAFEHAVALLCAADGRSAEAAARLVARADERAARLEGELAAAHARGSTRRPPPKPWTDAGVVQAWRTRLVERARQRGGVPPAPPNEPARDAVRRLSSALYAVSRDELVAALTARRARTLVPSAAGPYNSLALAARTLGEIASLSSPYLAALVGMLGELGALAALPPQAAPRAVPRPKRRGR
jgi:hypothetical protein